MRGKIPFDPHIIIFLSKRLIIKFYEENKAKEQLMAALKAKN